MASAKNCNRKFKGNKIEYIVPIDPWLSHRICMPSVVPVALRSGSQFALLLQDFVSSHPIPSESPVDRFEADCYFPEHASASAAVPCFLKATLPTHLQNWAEPVRLVVSLNPLQPANEV